MSGSFNMTMRPSHIRFCQADIDPKFPDGDLVNEVIREVMNGNITTSRFLPIDVAKYDVDGNYYTDNNKTLYLFRVLEYCGRSKDILVNEIDFYKIWYRMSTRNKGTSVRIRGGYDALPHSIKEIEEKRKERESGEGMQNGEKNLKLLGWQDLIEMGAAEAVTDSLVGELEYYEFARRIFSEEEEQNAATAITKQQTRCSVQ